ncbi:putative fucosyltransferase-like protein [Capsicum annuum]|uniref:Fucosyltransferase n=1 Tax=Capsicum annuum TaxID=4072 RepID=A0A2G2YKL3_CAPAN|nr:putative fucosyltransferase-like protein isoform X4 [Capsicum annuum]PHT70131.1 putative fucosyltransferase-like protein [Capsicum annuum]
MAAVIPIQRLPRNEVGSPSTTSVGSSSSPTIVLPQKKWSSWLPLLVSLVVLVEISFLGRLDMAEKANLVNSWADSFYQFTTSSWSIPIVDISSNIDEVDRDLVPGSCEEWLERQDSVEYSRDFDKDPIFVHGGEKDWKYCAVGCKFGVDSNKKPDASFGTPQQAGTAGVLRSMESAQYYPENDIVMARRRGYDIVMTTSLSSDVPVGYFSWAEYDIMAPVQSKTENALAAAFISNCGARNFRLQALEVLEREKIKIDSFGSCHHNRDGNVDKVETLKRFKFSFAFENSNEEDYVTEKFFQSLVAGSIPVVIGAPNIQDFAPSPNSLLHIKELKDAETVANTMKYLAANPSAYNEMLGWKVEGPSDSFKALVDMAAVHSSCRLCIFLATSIREREEQSPKFMERPCKCTRGSETVYHVYVRERGRFEMESIFLRSSNLSLEAFESALLLKFKSLKHVPIWKEERPQILRGGDELKLYRLHPLGMTQRQALYNFRFKGDTDFRDHIESHPCAKFEAIFV